MLWFFLSITSSITVAMVFGVFVDGNHRLKGANLPPPPTPPPKKWEKKESEPEWQLPLDAPAANRPGKSRRGFQQTAAPVKVTNQRFPNKLFYNVTFLSDALGSDGDIYSSMPRHFYMLALPKNRFASWLEKNQILFTWPLVIPPSLPLSVLAPLTYPIVPAQCSNCHWGAEIATKNLHFVSSFCCHFETYCTSFRSPEGRFKRPGKPENMSCDILCS